jgi:hypothetical protein
MHSKQAPAETRAAASAASDTESTPVSSTETTAEARRRRTAIAAFYRAQARGFAPGKELEDWLEAEREIDALDAGRHEQAATAQPAPAAGGRVRPEQPAPARGRAPRRARTTRATTQGADVQARNRGES